MQRFCVDCRIRKGSFRRMPVNKLAVLFMTANKKQQMKIITMSFGGKANPANTFEVLGEKTASMVLLKGIEEAVENDNKDMLKLFVGKLLPDSKKIEGTMTHRVDRERQRIQDMPKAEKVKRLEEYNKTVIEGSLIEADYEIINNE